MIQSRRVTPIPFGPESTRPLPFSLETEARPLKERKLHPFSTPNPFVYKRGWCEAAPPPVPVGAAPFIFFEGRGKAKPPPPRTHSLRE